MKLLAGRLAVLVLGLGLASATAFAADSEPKYSGGDEARQAIDEGNYDKAIGMLLEANSKQPGNADTLNLLGFSHRKLGRFDEALKYYTEALAIEPKHRGANEYLGELYLETNQLPKAEERLAVLDDACVFGCDEYNDLKAAIEAYRAKQGS